MEEGNGEESLGLEFEKGNLERDRRADDDRRREDKSLREAIGYGFK